MTKQLQHRIRILNILALSFFLALCVAYVYYLSVSVLHVVIRKDVLQETTIVRSEISELESTYIAHKQALPEHAESHATLVAVTDKVFLTNDAPNLVVSR